MDDLKNKTSVLFDIFFGLRKKIFIYFYLVIVATTGTTILLALGELISIPAKFLILFTIIIVTVAIVFGTFLSVLLDLPRIIYDFDQIKNDIASRRINTPEVFGEAIISFLCSFFNFSFFNIKHAFIKIVNTEILFSSDLISSLIDKQTESHITGRCRETENLLFLGPYRMEDRNLYLYVFPIWFEHHWLGFLGIFTDTKLLKIFRSFLVDFENTYLDDQLFHVLEIKKNSMCRHLCKKLNEVSNKIIRKEIKDIQEYSKDILGILLDELHCSFGLFVLPNDGLFIVSSFVELPEYSALEKYCKERYHKKGLILEPKSSHATNIAFKYVLEVPVLSTFVKGCLVLFDDDDVRLDWAKDILTPLVDIRISNDLDTLGYLLSNMTM